jgi:hypothetical protein
VVAARPDHVMPFDPSRMLRVEITSTLCVLPLVIWLTLYLTQRCWSVDFRASLSWLRRLRWVSWLSGVTVLLPSLRGGHLPWVYGMAMANFSFGLSIPEGWIQRRFLR